MSGKKYLCIHGHFYQPPREDAWTNEITPQPSAAPFHDWNERIFQECYKPNAHAVIVDDSDNVITKVNNYEYLSFNFGATLIHWIKKFHPKTYNLIIDADKVSVTKHKGHGNAIAMVYNHIIMPLANERDKITQIKWGVEDFKFHFHREPEAIWLSETACNQATVEALIQKNIKYIILDPSQAEKTRKAKRGKWKDVSNGNINPKIAYRCYSEIHKDKFINIFFYDGPLSRNIAFDDHIYDATKLTNRISQNIDPKCKTDQIISSAIDGETFGHHKHFAERTLAYFFYELAARTGFTVTNFGEYLAEHPAEYEVKIKSGPDGEGTSWSCVHGVGRWKEDCGCSGGGMDGWNQKWRSPLRDSLNWLRDELAKIYEDIGNQFLKNVWDARNDYIKVILNPDLKTGSEFFYHNAKKYLSANESEFCIKLLEMQRYGLLMFTSCGWFFADISGIETIQILQYAARSIELAYEVSGKNLENEFLEKIAEAKSNKFEEINGREIYLRHFAKRIPAFKN
jgi:alpha-amylase/alpha-mannosidase (GH57 family)